MAAWTVLSLSAVTAIGTASGKPVVRAVILMGATLTLTWIGLGGGLQRWFRDPIRARVAALPGSWQVKFVLFCTLLALAEETITTSLTNLAPLFGVPYGKAYITASGNYLDVVCLHSVVVFVPMFVCWAWMLGRWDFRPNAVLLLFGLTGTLAEVSFGGAGALLNVGFWSFIYGLMIYLPGYSLPERKGLRRPGARHYAMAVLLPFLFVAPVAGVVSVLHPVKIHFPPLDSGL
jgi:hypothetical protein